MAAGPPRKEAAEIRYLSKSIVFLSPSATLFTGYPQRFHRIVPAATAASGEFRLANAARYLFWAPLDVLTFPLERIDFRTDLRRSLVCPTEVLSEDSRT